MFLRKRAAGSHGYSEFSKKGVDLRAIEEECCQRKVAGFAPLTKVRLRVTTSGYEALCGVLGLCTAPVQMTAAFRQVCERARERENERARQRGERERQQRDKRLRAPEQSVWSVRGCCLVASIVVRGASTRHHASRRGPRGKASHTRARGREEYRRGGGGAAVGHWR